MKPCCTVSSQNSICSFWYIGQQASPGQTEWSTAVVRDSDGGSWCCWCKLSYAIKTQFKAQNAYSRVHFTYLPWGALLWHRPWRQHSKVPPIRTQYLEGSGPMRVLHSAGSLILLLCCVGLGLYYFNIGTNNIVDRQWSLTGIITRCPGVTRLTLHLGP